MWLLSKMYKLLLKWHTKDEKVKSVMIYLAQDIGHNIQFSSWEKLWRVRTASNVCWKCKEKEMWWTKAF